MNQAESRAFYNRVGKENGWDFSRLQVVAEGRDWDFFQEVVKHADRQKVVLDIGTGGGELALSYADYAMLVIGIDDSREMIGTAQQNLVRAKADNVRFHQMDAKELMFTEGFFDLITCRHAPFDACEIRRVLKPGGSFLTQQVGEADKENIKRAFGRGQTYGVENGVLRDASIRKLQEAGFSDIQLKEYNATEYYQTAEDLLFLLKHTPIIPDFGEIDGDYEIFEAFIQRFQTEKGIQTNSTRWLVMAR